MSRLLPSTRYRHACTRPRWRLNSSRVAAGSPVRHRSTSRTSSTYAAATATSYIVHDRPGAVTRSLKLLISLGERTGAFLAQPAPGALAAAPHSVVERLHLIEHRAVIGDDAELEVAAARALGAK